MDILAILQQFGFPIALCAVLLLAIRQQNRQLVRSYTDRINTLEAIVKTQGEKIDVLQNQMVERTQEYANSLKDIAGRYASATHEVFATMRDILPVLRQLVRSIRETPCRYEQEHRPHPAPAPAPEDLPADPRDRPTDKAMKRA